MKQRGEIWWCDIARPDGTRLRRSLKTSDKLEAQELHDRLRSEMWREARLGQKPKRSFDEAALRWIQEMEHKRSLDDDRSRIKWIRPHLKGYTLDQINNTVVRDILEKMQPRGKPMSGATRNRYIALVRSIIRKAHREWEWLDAAPAFRLYRETTRRIRWLTPAEAKQLIKELPAHWKVIVQFALATGLRKNNILQLRWSQIDMARRVAWVHPDEAKAGRGIGVPLNQTAVNAIQACMGAHDEFVFTFEGKPMRIDSNSAWRSALLRAGIKDFRFHDLRHTWASWHIQNGTGLAELQEMGGWESAEMVRRYAHLAPDHMHSHASKLDDLLGTNNGTFTAQNEKGLTRKIA
ncbi:tyrosine-type recombinase/integrase [Silvimonas terrae]|uniref:tyrosine-type recombinase/integrase n=1 Tax=Silvimonas terrae TaxID=300266 RepID=UPI003570A693